MPRRADTSPPGAAPPEDMEFDRDRRVPTGSGDVQTVELWDSRSRREAMICILNGPILGTIANAGTAHPDLQPDPDAVEQYGAEWVDEQLQWARVRIAYRWGRI